MNTVAEMIKPIPGPFFAVLIGYFVLMAIIGYVSSKQTNNLKDFFVMSGKAGAIVAGFAYFSTQYSMSTFMGCPASCYKAGFSGMSISVPGVAFSIILPAIFVGRKLMQLGHRNGFLTLADYIADRYESKGLRTMQALLMILFLIPMMGAQTIGAGLILRTYTGLPEWVGIVAMGIIVIMYCMTGGIRGAMLTDVIQGGLMVATAIVTFTVSVKLGGGMEAITNKLAQMNPEYLTHPGVGKLYGYRNYVSQVLLWSFFSIGQPALCTKFFTMKNHRVLFKAVILGSLGMCFAATLIEWSGTNAIVSIAGLKGKDIDFVVPLILQRAVSPVISSLLIAGIMAAGMSSIDSYLISSTGAITRDIYQSIINPQATDKDVLRLSRWVTVIVGCIAIFFGISRPAAIFDIILFSYGGLGIWATPMLWGIYWKGATKLGAYAGVLVGEAVYLYITLAAKQFAVGFHPLIPAWIVSMAAMWIVSLVTPKLSKETIARHFAA